MTMTPAPDPAILRAVERLDYRVTAGDIAAQAGLDVNLAQQGLLALASEAGGHLQVAESGDVVYQFPQNFREVLRNKSFRLRLKEWWEKVWRVLFYLIRISFGIVLVLLIVLAIAALVILAIAASSAGRDDNDGGGIDFGGGGGGFWFFPDFGWIFYPNYTDHYRRKESQSGNLNFLESIYSFLFGDGNPNADLEERRWRTIGTVIRNSRGAVIAEQISPYLDDVGQGFDQEYEQYMLPVLTRFDGRPEVSPEGQLVYHFPSLQTTVVEKTKSRAIPPFLREALWRFTQASSGQKITAIVLGCVLLVLAGVLNLWVGGVAIAGGALTFVKAIAVISLGYSVAFLGIPLTRYSWLRWRNRKIQARNNERELRSHQLAQADPLLEQKLTFAQQFAAETVIRDEDLIYSTETDLIEQESEQSDRIDAEWRERLEGRG
jgi:hypothetical protein